MILDANFLEFIECLNKNEVRFVLIGGYAVVLNGHSRSTGDLDIFIESTEENAEKVLKAIDDFGFGSIGFTKEDLLYKDGVVQMGTPTIRSDILSNVDGITFEETFASAKDHVEENVSMKVIHINHLIASKLAVGRKKDIADVEALQKILNKRK